MDNVDQLKKIIDETEFSDKVKDKVKELSVKAKLRKEAGAAEGDCLTKDERSELVQLIKADMVLDAIEIEGHKAYLAEVDRLLDTLRK